MVFTLIFWGLNTVNAQTSLKDDKAAKATEVKKFIKKDCVVRICKRICKV